MYAIFHGSVLCWNVGGVGAAGGPARGRNTVSFGKPT